MKTKDKILLATQEILATGGIGAVSFDAIARKLGLSKQAVLYWYPSKQDLLAELFLGWLQAEVAATEQGLAGTVGPQEAVASFVRALAGFHLGNLDRFRIMYLVPQTLPLAAQDRADGAVLQQIHATTARMYGALADRLVSEPQQARRQAVAIHAAVLGLVVMVGLSEGVGDPLRHSRTELVEALASRLAGPDQEA